MKAKKQQKNVKIPLRIYVKWFECSTQHPCMNFHHTFKEVTAQPADVILGMVWGLISAK